MEFEKYFDYLLNTTESCDLSVDPNANVAQNRLLR